MTSFKHLSTSAVKAFKWKPTNGNSFRTFAEYRLKVVQQSPLMKGRKVEKK